MANPQGPCSLPGADALTAGCSQSCPKPTAHVSGGRGGHGSPIPVAWKLAGFAIGTAVLALVAVWSESAAQPVAQVVLLRPSWAEHGRNASHVHLGKPARDTPRERYKTVAGSRTSSFVPPASPLMDGETRPF
jgi:hypothetical protein